MSELGRDVSVQWCNYDSNYVESMPNSNCARICKKDFFFNERTLFCLSDNCIGQFQISWTLICIPCIRFAQAGPCNFLLG
jgi:hypothetical protein